MRVFIVNGVIDHAVGIKNALCVMNDTLDIFNQMSGKELTAYLIDGEVRIVDVSGNALTVYYPKEEDGGYVGLNTTESSFIRVYVENQEVQRIRFTQATTGVLYPLDKVPENTDRLAIFFWEEESRPISPEDVFRKVQRDKGQSTRIKKTIDNKQ